MRRRESGFSLLELMIALAIVAFVLAAASTFFIGVVKQYKVQSKITESNVEGVIGLELLRQDLESLGFGLPWDMNNFTYSEPDPQGNTSAPPRAVGSVNGGTDNSDYLIIRSARVGMASAAGKWTTLRNDAPPVRNWGSNEENLASDDQVIVLSPGSKDFPSQVLRTPQAGVAFGDNGANLSPYVPGETFETNIVYGIDDSLSLMRPFNRADYYIADNAAYRTPLHCASNTGVLVKAVMMHDTSGTRDLLPLLDCIADLQVRYGFDNNADGVLEWWDADAVSSFSAAELRGNLVEIHVHVLAQIGQRDNSYTYPFTNVDVGPPGSGGRNFNFATRINGYEHYRWKVYNIVVKPRNLGN